MEHAEQGYPASHKRRNRMCAFFGSSCTSRGCGVGEGRTAANKNKYQATLPRNARTRKAGLKCLVRSKSFSRALPATPATGVAAAAGSHSPSNPGATRPAIGQLLPCQDLIQNYN
eukprot:scaffold35954_cov157-Isochrysis_galbana.AAC.1